MKKPIRINSESRFGPTDSNGIILSPYLSFILTTLRTAYN